MMQYNITFDDGDTWRVEDESNQGDGHITAWRPDPNDKETGSPMLMSNRLDQLFRMMQTFRTRELLNTKGDTKDGEA